jgi:hypothetical protein
VRTLHLRCAAISRLVFQLACPGELGCSFMRFCLAWILLEPPSPPTQRHEGVRRVQPRALMDVPMLRRSAESRAPCGLARTSRILVFGGVSLRPSDLRGTEPDRHSVYRFSTTHALRHRRAALRQKADSCQQGYVGSSGRLAEHRRDLLTGIPWEQLKPPTAAPSPPCVAGDCRSTPQSSSSGAFGKTSAPTPLQSRRFSGGRLSLATGTRAAPGPNGAPGARHHFQQLKRQPKAAQRDPFPGRTKPRFQWGILIVVDGPSVRASTRPAPRRPLPTPRSDPRTLDVIDAKRREPGSAAGGSGLMKRGTSLEALAHRHEAQRA